jgi:hypothetical protein
VSAGRQKREILFNFSIIKFSIKFLSINPQKSKKGPKLRHEKADISQTTMVAPLSTHHSVARREGSPPHMRSGAKVSAGRQKREILFEFPS